MRTTTSTVPLGQVLFSIGINQYVSSNPSFTIFIMQCLNRHKNANWGELPQEDIDSNNEALNGSGRLFSSYKISDDIDVEFDKIWIITEWDRSVTTILFPNEY